MNPQRIGGHSFIKDIGSWGYLFHPSHQGLDINESQGW